MINNLPNIILNDEVKTVYNFSNSYTSQELLSKFYEKINECINTSNKSLSFLEYLKNEGLPNEVIKELNKMYEDGRLTELIDNMANNLTESVVNINNSLTQTNNSLLQTNNSLIEAKNNVDNLTHEINTLKDETLPNYLIDGGVW